ncbi:MAG: hypothetical protein IT437_10750 [Phycisphaerales bacterium]|nr:hypothetical protein [Phycisphaerales bacterium]
MNPFRTLLAAAAVLAATGLACAQGSPPATQPGPGISVEFPGGTVNEYVAALKKAAGGTPVNAVVSEEAGVQVLPPISLRSVSPYVALSAIPAAAGFGTGNWEVHPIAEPGAASVNTVSVDFLAQDRGGRGLEVFSTQRLLSGDAAIAPDVLLTAVDTALQMEGGGKSRADVMFHKDSGLLLVRGSPSQLNAVSQVISQLQDDATRRGKDTARTRQVSASQEAEIRKCQVRISLAEQRLQGISQQLAETEQMVKAGTTPIAELRSQQQQRAQAAAELEIAKIDLGRAQAEAAAGVDAQGDDEIARLRGIVAQLQAEVQALKQALGDQKGGGTR